MGELCLLPLLPTPSLLHDLNSASKHAFLYFLLLSIRSNRENRPSFCFVFVCCRRSLSNMQKHMRRGTEVLGFLYSRLLHNRVMNIRLFSNWRY
ncbi:hypothetical protein KP509_19G004800 [Ceratopteris richardii]|uniref:Uncharacterized protein n=1 Tax=Ceratopteris richardii TaxID=49495 RepID=A0A8T2SL36_CERRI|nr:hypothetical protein KP509_19G004800 [Ceratopteris richardii]